MQNKKLGFLRVELAAIPNWPSAFISQRTTIAIFTIFDTLTQQAQNPHLLVELPRYLSRHSPCSCGAPASAPWSTFPRGLTGTIRAHRDSPLSHPSPIDPPRPSLLENHSHTTISAVPSVASTARPTSKFHWFSFTCDQHPCCELRMWTRHHPSKTLVRRWVISTSYRNPFVPYDVVLLHRFWVWRLSAAWRYMSLLYRLLQLVACQFCCVIVLLSPLLLVSCYC